MSGVVVKVSTVVGETLGVTQRASVALGYAAVVLKAASSVVFGDASIALEIASAPFVLAIVDHRHLLGVHC